MLRQRVTTALILLPLILGVVFLVPLHYFAAVALILVYFMGIEWGRLSGIKNRTSISLYAMAISLVNTLLWFCSDDIIFWPSPSWPWRLIWDPWIILLAASLVAILISVFIVLFYSTIKKWWANIPIRCLLGVVLLSAFFMTLVSIRNIGYLEDTYLGAKFLLLMFLIIWAADTGAYFVGKYLGKRPLASNLSPNKTWEGAAGGIVLSLIVAWLASFILSIAIQTPWVYFCVIAALAGLSIFGDLFESALKRETGYKDSGNLLPGHGGLLDRLDSSIVVAPVYFVSFSYLGWF
jgi:phosphatidate cytidylyltransferase